jgi:hypothetical protein
MPIKKNKKTATSDLRNKVSVKNTKTRERTEKKLTGTGIKKTVAKTARKVASASNVNRKKAIAKRGANVVARKTTRLNNKADRRYSRDDKKVEKRITKYEKKTDKKYISNEKIAKRKKDDISHKKYVKDRAVADIKKKKDKKSDWIKKNNGTEASWKKEKTRRLSLYAKQAKETQKAQKGKGLRWSKK